MDPNVWGPKLWFVLHTISFNYPEKQSSVDKQQYHDFFVNLKHMIPCVVCREHYTEHIHNYPIIYSI